MSTMLNSYNTGTLPLAQILKLDHFAEMQQDSHKVKSFFVKLSKFYCVSIHLIRVLLHSLETMVRFFFQNDKFYMHCHKKIKRFLIMKKTRSYKKL